MEYSSNYDFRLYELGEKPWRTGVNWNFREIDRLLKNHEDLIAGIQGSVAAAQAAAQSAAASASTAADTATTASSSAAAAQAAATSAQSVASNASSAASAAQTTANSAASAAAAAQSTAESAATAATNAAGKIVYRNEQAAATSSKVWTGSAMTNASGIATFTPPNGHFTMVHSVQATAERSNGTLTPTTVVTKTATSITVKASETVALTIVGISLIGLQAAPANIPVSVTVHGV